MLPSSGGGEAEPRVPGLRWTAGEGVAHGARGPVRLSALERALLGALVEAAGAPVPRDRLGADGRSVDFAVRRLRRKLERDPGDPRIVLTVHGVGYRLGVERDLPPAAPPRPLLELRDRQVDLGLGVVIRLGEEIALTTLQREVLRVLVDAGGAVVPRDRLARAVWGHARGRGVERVVHELRRRLEALPAEPVHLRTAPGGYRWVVEQPRTNLRDLPALVVGREAELAALADRAGRTLILGPPGVGKSHLARRLCQRLADRLPGGAWWVPAAGVGDLDLLCGRVAGALGLGDRMHPRLLAAELRRRPPLALLFDDLEPLEGLGELWGALVGGGARLFATATERIDADFTLVLGGLPTADGVRLYREAAPAGVDGGTDAEVVALVEALEGHPLAILLASRRALTAPAAHRVDDPSLQSAFERAARGASAAERRVLRACTAFRAPFDEDAARFVTEGTPAILDRLVERSLLHREPSEAGRRVYRLHGVLADWIRAAGRPPPEVAERRVRWFVARAEHHLRTPEDAIRAEVDRTLPDLREVAAEPDPAVGALLARLFHDCSWLPDALSRSLVDALVRREAPFPGSAEVWRLRSLHRLRDGDPDGARRALATAVSHGLEGWGLQDARVLVEGTGDKVDGLDPGPTPPAGDPTKWMARRGRYLTDRALSDGHLDEALTLLSGASQRAEAAGHHTVALLTQSWWAEAAALAGADPEWVAARIEDVVLALEARGRRRHAAAVAWRAAGRRADLGQRAQARALVERHADQHPYDRLLVIRARMVVLRTEIDGDPARALPEALDLAATAAAVGDAHGRSTAQLFLALLQARLGRREAALVACERVTEGRYLPVAAAAVAARLDPARVLPRPLPVVHWVNDVVALASGSPPAASVHPVLRALAALA